MRKNQGMVHVYTGEGKGKTTAALGVALRAIGYDGRVFVSSFIKEGLTGEIKAAHRIRPFLIFDSHADDNSEEVKVFEKPGPDGRLGFKTRLKRDNITEDDRGKAAVSLEKARAAMLSGTFRIVILDEVIVAHDLGLVTFDQIKQLIQEKPAEVELILTGRGATQRLIDLADVVTQMKEIKHPYQKGLPAREGIDY